MRHHINKVNPRTARADDLSGACQLHAWQCAMCFCEPILIHGQSKVQFGIHGSLWKEGGHKMLSYNFSGEVTINERIQRRSDRWSSKNEAEIEHYFSYRPIIPRGDVRIGDKHP